MSTEKLIDCICADTSGCQYTLLGEAIFKEDLEVVRLLVEGGVDINKPIRPSSDAAYFRPLPYAKRWKSVDIVKLLKDAGAKA